MIEANGLKKDDIAFYGVGVPGTADSKTGLVEYCPNLGWEDVPAGAIFKKYLGAEVLIAQDSRLAAWAEYLLGAGRNYQLLHLRRGRHRDRRRNYHRWEDLPWGD